MSEPKALYQLCEEWRKPSVVSSTTANEAVYNTCADELEAALRAWDAVLKNERNTASDRGFTAGLEFCQQILGIKP